MAFKIIQGKPGAGMSYNFSEILNPLFVLLKTEYYEAFADGSKCEVLHRYGARWNENTCLLGRHVVLSKGYGKQHRMIGRVSKFKRQYGTTFDSANKAAILAVFGTLHIEIACISIELTHKGK